MPDEGDDKLTLETALRDLHSVRGRMDRAKAWLRDGETAMAAAALAEDVQRICMQATSCRDPRRVKQLLGSASQRLQDLEKMLGLH